MSRPTESNITAPDDPDEVTLFIFKHYRSLFTTTENLAWISVRAEAKAKKYGPPLADFYRHHYVSSDPAAVKLLADGIGAFKTRVRDRLLIDEVDKIKLNHCAKCGALPRTPDACLCPKCNHTWYETRRK
jgi:hypothetical protein